MPRKKVVDPLVTVLEFFEQQPQEICEVASRIVLRTVRQRFPPATAPTKPAKRTRKVGTALVIPPPTPENTTMLPPVPEPAPRRRRRLRADSPKPPNEATPIVPLQEEVGGDEAYTGE